MVSLKILIFIPCYNCSKEVEHLIERLSKINLVNYQYSFLFIDNNSIDKTIDSILNSTKKFNLQNFKIFKDLVTSFNLTFLNKCDDIEKSIISEYFQRCFDIEIDNGESGSAS